MGRLDRDRQGRLEPSRMDKAVTELSKLGYWIQYKSDTELRFVHGSEIIKFFPYSGWHTGKSIKDGRGLKKLLAQLNKKENGNTEQG